VSFWSDKRVLVTGGRGFLGSHLVERLAAEKPAALIAPERSDYDLRNRLEVERCLATSKPDVLIDAAAVVGGIGANRAHPGQFFFENAIMGIQLVEEARRAGVGKAVCLGTVCAYPERAPIPFREEDLWSGYPEETNAPYGLAKKMVLVQLQAYRREYGFRGIYLIPVNLYGPRDDFDLERGHVIPSMIRKFVEGAESAAAEVILWGDGSPTREFLYVEDAAEAILAAAELYDGEEPVNLGTGVEISIADLAALVAREAGYGGRIVWDASRGNGQPRRRLDTRRAREAFGWVAGTLLEDGLRKTVSWYRENRNRAAAV
jgi:GDP-L-fucose synthase